MSQWRKKLTPAAGGSLSEAWRYEENLIIFRNNNQNVCWVEQKEQRKDPLMQLYVLAHAIS